MQIWKYVYTSLVLLTIFVWLVVYTLPDNNLHIIACDVGQGDAILVVYKNIQILTDGGPDKKVIDCLSRHIPFWDRDIELVISTHPDADHSTGLVTVLKRYKVNNIMMNSINSGTQVIKALENEVGSRGIQVVKPVGGTSIGLGLIHLDIFNPDGNLVNGLTERFEGDNLGFYVPKEVTNVYSVTYRLGFGDFRGLFTGDISPEVSDRIATENQVGLVNYIKVPHHGSKNGLTQNLLEKTMPKVAVISVGENNKFGHPAQETLKMLMDKNVRIYRTDEMGDVEVVTNGKEFWLAN